MTFSRGRRLPTARSVAKIAGVTNETAQFWLSGRRRMPVDVVAAILEARPDIKASELVSELADRIENPVDLRSREHRGSRPGAREKPRPVRRSALERSRSKK